MRLVRERWWWGFYLLVPIPALVLALLGLRTVELQRGERLLLSARGQEVDRVTGFEAGADDYVVKPFSLRELVARVRVGLRRRSHRATQRSYAFGDVIIDVPSRRVNKAGRDVTLTRKEFEILTLLAQRQGEVIPRDEFCDLIWGEEIFITPRVIDTHISSVRKKIDDGGGAERIQSVRGIGYRLE